MDNDRLLEIQQRKIRQKINYLRTELEETTLIFEDAVQNFNSDFGEYFNNDVESIPDAPKVSSTEMEFNIPKKEVHDIYRRIAIKAHPDKLISQDIPEEEKEHKINLFKEAKIAVDNNDLAKVIDIADELKINLNEVIDESDNTYLEENVVGLLNKIEELKKTYAWIWFHAQQEQSEDELNTLKDNILSTLGLNKEKNNGK
tara:strand:- start:160 stop:762 length:603 start_codon:yes stop_codon:yes gene_type:complete